MGRGVTIRKRNPHANRCGCGCLTQADLMIRRSHCLYSGFADCGSFQISALATALSFSGGRSPFGMGRPLSSAHTLPSELSPNLASLASPLLEELTDSGW
jgi:hypothetical protein